MDHHGLPQPPGVPGRAATHRYYHDRDAAEQAWQRAAQVGINQTRKELGVSDRALRTAWQRHGLGLPQRPTATPTTPLLSPTFVALNRGLLPARERSDQELAAWVRREEEYATLGASVVVELNSESRTRRPATRAWAITRRAQRAHRHRSDRQHRNERRHADRVSRTDRSGRAYARVQEREVLADAADRPELPAIPLSFPPHATRVPLAGRRKDHRWSCSPRGEWSGRAGWCASRN